MKFMNISINYHNLIYFLFIILKLRTIITINENCNNPCISCQNTLYFLKFRGDADCRFNRCQGLVRNKKHILIIFNKL